MLIGLGIGIGWLGYALTWAGIGQFQHRPGYSLWIALLGPQTGAKLAGKSGAFTGGGSGGINPAAVAKAASLGGGGSGTPATSQSGHRISGGPG